jgi:flagellar hook protein FlgE
MIPPATPLKLTGIQVAGAATPAFDVDLKLDGMTQNASSFYVSSLAQDGYAPGELTGLNIGDDGIISARYSNGQTQSAGQIVLANFRNQQGLESTSGGYWKETAASGAPLKNTPGSGNFGKIASGSLEDSNVDLTSELVNMMTAQRAYQANAQTIKTQDQVMSTLVNLR